MSAYDFPLLIKHLLTAPLRQYARQEIVYRDQLRMTYQEFGGRVARLGSALHALGVRRGQVVAVMDWDSHRYLECFFGVPMSGATLMTVNIRLSVEQIVYTLNHARAEVIFCNQEFLSLLQAVQPLLTTAQKFICLSDDGVVPAHFAWDGEYEALLAGGDPGFAFPEFDERTQATVFYTTGTTGNPKGVFYSHRQIVLHTLAELGGMGLQRGGVYMPMTPMFHVHGWGMPFTATVLGVKQIYPGRYAPDLLAKWFVREKVTFTHCVPTILQMFLQASVGMDVSGAKIVIGGSALPRALAKAAAARGLDVITGYGMSETGPIVTLAMLDEAHKDGTDREFAYRCRAGRAAPLVDMRVVDEDLNELPRDGVSAGEVVLRAPWLTQGYLHNPEASEALWEGGWLHTGDIGTVDAEGFLTITDRIKDVVKTGGEWVSSLQLEDILAEHPSVAEVAVVGVPDVRWGERPLAAVVLKQGATVDLATLRAHVQERVEQGVISKFAVPERVEFLAEIPRTSVGKLNKKLLRAQFGVVTLST